ERQLRHGRISCVAPFGGAKYLLCCFVYRPLSPARPLGEPFQSHLPAWLPLRIHERRDSIVAIHHLGQRQSRLVQAPKAKGLRRATRCFHFETLIVDPLRFLQRFASRYHAPGLPARSLIQRPAPLTRTWLETSRRQVRMLPP